MAVTKDDILAELQRREQSKGVSRDDIMAEISRREALNTQPKRGFVERTGSALKDRLRNVSETLNAQGLSVLGKEQTLPETALQLTGQGLGAFGDVLGNAAISGYRALPDVKYGIEEGASALGSIPIGDETLGNRAGSALASLASSYDEFQTENPRAARNLEALYEVGSFALPIKGAETLSKPVKMAGKGIAKAATKARRLIPKPQKITAQQLRNKASQFYKVADEVGGTVKPNKVTELVNDIVLKIDEKGSSLPLKAQEALRKFADPEKTVRKAQDIFENLRDQQLTLEGFQAIDQELGSIAYAKATPEAASRKIIQMQKQLREMVDNISPDDLTGSNKGFKAYKAGREIWKKQAKIRDIENITAKAFATHRSAENLQKALARFAAKPDNLRGFTKAEIKAIREASEAGGVQELIRTFGGRLSGLIGIGTGNPAYGAGLSLASQQARNVGDDIMIRKMDDIASLIAQGQVEKLPFGSQLGRKALTATAKTGKGIENLYSGRTGQLSSLATLQQLMEEELVKQQNERQNQ